MQLKDLLDVLDLNEWYIDLYDREERLLISTYERNLREDTLWKETLLECAHSKVLEIVPPAVTNFLVIRIDY